MVREDNSEGQPGQRGQSLRVALGSVLMMSSTILAGGLAFAALTRWGWTLFWVLVVSGLVGPFLWVMGSIFSPAEVDRRCPDCGEESLVRPRRDDILGIVCLSCGFRDDEEYLAYLEEYLDDHRDDA